MHSLLLVRHAEVIIGYVYKPGLSVPLCIYGCKLLLRKEQRRDPFYLDVVIAAFLARGLM